MGESRDIVRRFFAAMQAGASAADDMMALFTDDACYVEPFNGRRTVHQGKVAVGEAMRAALSLPLPQMRIEIDRLEVDGHDVRVEWTCYSPALPKGRGRGENRYQLRRGLIARLETQLLGAGAETPKKRRKKA